MKNIIAAVLSVFLFASCAREPAHVFRVGTNVWPGYECLYIARELGYYNGTTIKLVEYSSSSEVLRDFRNGVIEAAALTMDEVLILKDQGHGPAVVLLLDTSNGADAVLSKPDIRSLKELRGKRVGVESTALGAFMLTRALQKAGLKSDEIKAVPVELSEHESAFLKGRVDAVVTFEPVRTLLLANGAKVIFDSSKIPNEIIDVLVVRHDAVDDNLDTIKSLMNGWFRAVSLLRQDPWTAARIASSRSRLSPEEFLTSLNGIKIPTLEDNLGLLVDNDSGFREGLSSLSKSMAGNGLIKKYHDPADVLDPRVLKEFK